MIGAPVELFLIRGQDPFRRARPSRDPKARRLVFCFDCNWAIWGNRAAKLLVDVDLQQANVSAQWRTVLVDELNQAATQIFVNDGRVVPHPDWIAVRTLNTDTLKLKKVAWYKQVVHGNELAIFITEVGMLSLRLDERRCSQRPTLAVTDHVALHFVTIAPHLAILGIPQILDVVPEVHHESLE